MTEETQFSKKPTVTTVTRPQAGRWKSRCSTSAGGRTFHHLQSKQTDVWGPSSVRSGSFPWDITAKTWCWQLTFILCQVANVWTYTSTPPYVLIAENPVGESDGRLVRLKSRKTTAGCGIKPHTWNACDYQRWGPWGDNEMVGEVFDNKWNGIQKRQWQTWVS